MRTLLPILAAACAVLPAPVLAEDLEHEAGRVREELSDPVRQAQVAVAAEAVTGAVMDMPAAPIVRAAAVLAGSDPEAVDPDVRVGDLVGPEAAQAPREFARRLPEMMGSMAVIAAALEDMVPQLREAMERIEDAAPGAY